MLQKLCFLVCSPPLQLVGWDPFHICWPRFKTSHRKHRAILCELGWVSASSQRIIFVNWLIFVWTFFQVAFVKIHTGTVCYFCVTVPNIAEMRGHPAKGALKSRQSSLRRRFLLNSTTQKNLSLVFAYHEPTLFISCCFFFRALPASLMGSKQRPGALPLALSAAAIGSWGPATSSNWGNPWQWEGAGCLTQSPAQVTWA